MNRYKLVTLLLVVIIFIMDVFVGCDTKTEQSFVDYRDINFSKLLAYCESNGQKKTNDFNSKEYYILSWADSDSSETGPVDFLLHVYKDKTMHIMGNSISPYNDYIQNETTYSVKFIFGSEVDNRLSFEVEFYVLMRVLQNPPYNYNTYVLEEFKVSDSKGTFDIENWFASCYYETSSSTNGIISLSNPNQTLREVSIDCFKQIKSYLLYKINIPLFINDNV